MKNEENDWMNFKNGKLLYKLKLLLEKRRSEYEIIWVKGLREGADKDAEGNREADYWANNAMDGIRLCQKIMTWS